MTGKHKTVLFGMYVIFAGLLLAMGAAARNPNSGSAQSGSSQQAQSSAPMSQGMMGGHGRMDMGKGMTEEKHEKMMAARDKVRDLVDDLMDNQAVMDKAKSLHGIKPLLEKNHVLLVKLNDEVLESWGMRGHMYDAAMHTRTRTTADAPSAHRAAEKETAASSAAHSRLVAQGRGVFAAHGCRICHGAEGKGTAMAPSLVGVGKKFSTEKIAHLIRHPATTRMPAFSESALPNADLKAVIAYVESLK